MFSKTGRVDLVIHVSDVRELEELVKGCRFTNKAHKAQLWERIIEEHATDELSEDELAMAAGGAKFDARDLSPEKTS